MSKTTAALDVITYGEAMAMFVAAETGPLASVGQFTKRVAGADLNVAIGLSRLGFKVGWMSRVGNDSFGQYVRDTLTKEGIDQGCVTTDERYPTGFQLKSKNDDGSDPAIEYFRKGSAASHLSLADYVADYVLPARHLHLTGVAPGHFRELARTRVPSGAEMRAAGKTISFDPNLRPTLWPSRAAMVEGLNALAALADWVLPGIGEGEILTGYTQPDDIAKFYLDQGARGVIIKLGAQARISAPPTMPAWSPASRSRMWWTPSARAMVSRSAWSARCWKASRCRKQWRAATVSARWRFR